MFNSINLDKNPCIRLHGNLEISDPHPEEIDGYIRTYCRFCGKLIQTQYIE